MSRDVVSNIVFGTLAILCVAWGLAGCVDEEPNVDSTEVQQRIASFEEIEKEIDVVRKNLQYPAAKDRIYYELFHERNDILKIAEGKAFPSGQHMNNSDKAIIRKLAWVVLGELQERRPEFEIIIQKEQQQEPVHPDVEKLPEEFK